MHLGILGIHTKDSAGKTPLPLSLANETIRLYSFVRESLTKR
jgi:hypothetical protein